MATKPSTYVILLRAIGPVTHRLMSMAAWREASAVAGFEAPETLVNTGNMIAGFDGSAIRASLVMADLLQGFGLGENVVPIVRKPSVLQRLIKADPIGEAAINRSNQTGVYFFAASKPDFSWLAAYDGPEAVHVVQDHLVIDFRGDVAQSGRLIRLIDKQCGVNTARNWNSVRRIAERCGMRDNSMRSASRSTGGP
ncbi:hypothetical protein VW35_03185 [Devosia soli]|uniref:DUF1697 domain-containing protein n=1 Tax=Devosia soli TaxID=361041 RepID=A0A0F5LFQ3_9HYPH|nr:DUF1697 domain-containing protein [Devosia soli]KKB81168.1 hypothetical protein VW35_03185 [Devosia soli]